MQVQRVPEQLVVHLPVMALIAGAGGRHVRLERTRMNLFDWIVLEYVANLVRPDVLAVDPWVDLRDVLRAVGTFVVGVLDERHGGLRRAARGTTRDRQGLDAAARHRSRHLGRRRVRPHRLLQQRLDGVEVSGHRFLRGAKEGDFGAQRLEVRRRLASHRGQLRLFF